MQFLTLGLVLHVHIYIHTCVLYMYVRTYVRRYGAACLCNAHCTKYHAVMELNSMYVGIAVWGETAKEGAILYAWKECIFRGDFIDSTEGNGQIEPRAGSGTEWGTSTSVRTVHSNLLYLLYSAYQQYICCDATPMDTAAVCLPYTSMHQLLSCFAPS